MQSLNSIIKCLFFLCIFGCSKNSETTPNTVKTASKTAASKPANPMGSTVRKVSHADEKPVVTNTISEPEKPVLKVYVKVEAAKPEKVEFIPGADWIKQYRTSVIEGDPNQPDRTTKLLVGPAKCGSIESATDEDAGENKPGVIFFLNCWHAGMGHTFSFFQSGQTITIEKTTVSEDEDVSPGPDDGIIHTLKVPKGFQVMVETLASG